LFKENTMKKLIAGNWKMNLNAAEARQLASDLQAELSGRGQMADYLVCPPFIYLAEIVDILKGSDIAVGGQDCSEHSGGAYTGDISAEMLKDIGCAYAILGHSERRQHHGETDELVARKAAKAHEHGLITIICVGETEAERAAGQEQEVVARQLRGSLPSCATYKNTVIAYEPVWAIGTGKTATPKDAEIMHGFIRQRLHNEVDGADLFRILYGGSMKPDNAVDLLQTANVDGGLIGGASLKADQFIAIAKSAQND
jgi:triosephosphate isomerase (TIM)